MVWCMRPGKSDDQHVLESLAIGVVAEISRWKLKMHVWRPVVPFWQGGGVCPVPEDDWCVPPCGYRCIRPDHWLGAIATWQGRPSSL